MPSSPWPVPWMIQANSLYSADIALEIVKDSSGAVIVSYLSTEDEYKCEAGHCLSAAAGNDNIDAIVFVIDDGIDSRYDESQMPLSVLYKNSEPVDSTPLTTMGVLGLLTQV